MAFAYIVGVDEVGRGPIAGPLCVGACVLVRAHGARFFTSVRGLKDSKQLPDHKREEWVKVLRRLEELGCIRLSTAFVSEKQIDTYGMAFALSRAVRNVLRLVRIPAHRSFVMLDGTLRAPAEYLFQESVIGGDEADLLIASASIVAKVRRDAYMKRIGRLFPQYGFEVHKGYGTKKHYEALAKHGACPAHRMSFLRNSQLRVPSR